MFRRVVILAGLVGVMAAAATPALAKQHVIAQLTTPKGVGFVYMARGLLTGHQYRIDVLSNRGHVKFVGLGTENYNYVANHQAGQGTKGLSLNGTTPKSFVVKQPVSINLTLWILAVQIQDRNKSSLTLRYVDLGKAR